MNALRSKALTIAVVMGSALAALAAPTSAFTDIVATTGTFSGQVTSNGANVLTSIVEHWSAKTYISSTSTNRLIARFKTGPAATLTDLLLSSDYNPGGNANANNTLPINLTDTSGTVLCTVTYNCNTATNTLYTNQASCNVALSANTEYQIRQTACSVATSTTYINVVARMTIP